MIRTAIVAAAFASNRVPQHTANIKNRHRDDEKDNDLLCHDTGKYSAASVPLRPARQ